MKATTSPAIEPLESRIAPAAVFTFTDIDGDIVRIVDSSDTLTPSHVTLSGGTRGQLQKLTLTAPEFAGADISFSVVRKPGGDGLVNVGFIDASGNDLGRVTVRGDLGRIVAGDATPTSAGLESLTVYSLAARGLTTQEAGGTLASLVTGALGRLAVRGSVVEASISVNGSTGDVTIGGSLVGGPGGSSGTIFSSGPMGDLTVGSILGGEGDNSGRFISLASIGDVRIARNLTGGAGSQSGTIEAGSDLGKVRIGVNLVGGAGDNSGEIRAAGTAGDLMIAGSVIGGAGESSGAVLAGTLGNVNIGGDLLGRAGASSASITSAGGAIGKVSIRGGIQGGGGDGSGSIESATTLGDVRIGRALVGDTGPNSARIRSDDDMGDVTIGGDMRGGSADGAGQILSDTGAIGRVKIGGWLVGGSISTDDTLVDAGVIRAGGDIESVAIKGSLFSGSATGGGVLVRSGAIVAGLALGPVNVGGSLLGNATNPVRIVGHNQETPSATQDLTIASVTVRGDALHAEILAGFSFNLFPENADASIGAVRVGGHWIAGSIVAGAEDQGAPGYGIGDLLQTVSDDPALTASIASITIGGSVLGTAGSVADHFGFVSQRIDRLRIGATSIALSAVPPADDILLPGTADVRVLEV